MNNVIETINRETIENVTKVHKILDKVLEVTANNFGDNEIIYDKQNNVIGVNFENGYTLIIKRTFEPFNVIITFNNASMGIVLAECIIGVDGTYRETYSRLDKDVRENISDYFTDIADIDVLTLGDSDTEPEVESRDDE